MPNVLGSSARAFDLIQREEKNEDFRAKSNETLAQFHKLMWVQFQFLVYHFFVFCPCVYVSLENIDVLKDFHNKSSV